MMTLAELTTFLGWASLIHIAVLVLSTVALLTMRKPIISMYSRLFGLVEQDLSALYFRYLAHYKALTLLFFVGPYLALKVMGQ